MRINNTAILTSFKTTAIKFKVTKKIIAQINWKIMGNQNLTNEISENSLSKSISGGTTYSNYNNHILEAGTNNATTKNQKTKAGSISAVTPYLP